MIRIERYGWCTIVLHLSDGTKAGFLAAGNGDTTVANQIAADRIEDVLAHQLGVQRGS